jgi:hypothetical protein
VRAAGSGRGGLQGSGNIEAWQIPGRLTGMANGSFSTYHICAPVR